MNNAIDTNVNRLQQASEWVQRLADPDESGDVFIEWQAWCRDPANAQAFEQMQGTWQDLVSARGAWVKQQIRRRQRRPSLALAASVLLTLGAATAWFVAIADRPERWNTAIGEMRHETLPDGSRIDLGADSQVIVRYSDEQRLLELTKGRALFTVARDATRPFVVRAGDLRVTAVGTAFDVRTAAQSTIVTVGEGRVRISSAQTRSIEPLLAAAGHRVRYSDDEERLAVSHVDPRLAQSLAVGVLQFQDEALQDVVGEVNRYTSRKILIADPEIAQTSFTGTIAADRVDDWLLSLEKIIPVVVDDLGPAGYRVARRSPEETT